MTANVIRVVGARVHNLKNITVEIPRDKLVVITGLSGSGKSSLAFDTIFAEGTASLCRITLRLRPSVPRADGKTRCRFHRGSLPSRFH